MREEIIRMAQEAGAVLADGTNAPPYYAFYPSELERFAELVAAAKKEECAAAQAVNERLWEAACEVTECLVLENMKRPAFTFGRIQKLHQALAIPNDTTAMQARLAEERERCAKVADDRIGPLNSVAAAIRGMK